MVKGKRVGKYELGKTLGSGSFSKVKLGQDDDGKQYAVKIIDKEQLVREHMEEQLKREISIMRMLNHPNIVRLYDVLQTQNHIYLVLELVTGGELFDRIVQAKKFDENTGRRFFQQMIVALHFCHRNGVAHRDLKPENLLVDDRDNIKITDFGLANMQKGDPNAQQNLLSTVCGTPNYVAPEVLKEEGYNGLTADVWSCGVILFVMLAGYLPFDDPQLNVLFQKIERGDYRMSKVFSDGAKDLIGKMLTVDPKKRITLDEVMKHPWFQKNWDRTVFDSLNGTTVKPDAAAGDWSKGAMEKVADAASPTTEDTGATAKLGAFELINQLTMGTMTGLTTNTPIKVGTRFIVGCTPKATFDALMELLTKMKSGPKNKDEKEIKGFLNKQKGLLTYLVTIVPTVVDDLTMIEVRRGRGDTFDFHDLYREIYNGLGPKVVSSETQAVTA
jgi:serine/threonine protein kinase